MNCKHETLDQCWVNVGSTSTTLGQHYISIGIKMHCLRHDDRSVTIIPLSAAQPLLWRCLHVSEPRHYDLSHVPDLSRRTKTWYGEFEYVYAVTITAMVILFSNKRSCWTYPIQLWYHFYYDLSSSRPLQAYLGMVPHPLRFASKPCTRSSPGVLRHGDTSIMTATKPCTRPSPDVLRHGDTSIMTATKPCTRPSPDVLRHGDTSIMTASKTCTWPSPGVLRHGDTSIMTATKPCTRSSPDVLRHGDTSIMTASKKCTWPSPDVLRHGETSIMT